MTSLIVLASCVAVPWLLGSVLKVGFMNALPLPAAARDRALGRYRRAALGVGVILLLAAAIAGALFVDPALLSRWPSAGSWFYSSLCLVTAWISIALSQRTPEESAAMPHWEVLRRVVQMSTLVVLATAMSVFLLAAVQPRLPLPPAGRTFAAALLSVGAVMVASPWLILKLGIWRVFPRRIEAGGVSWQLAHLPSPTPFLTHAAGLPWLRTVLLSDGLINRVPPQQWHTLVRYEVGGSETTRSDRWARWAVAVPLSLVVFVAASGAAEGDARKLVAASSLAVFFCLVATWVANRQPSSRLTLETEGPSLQELAHTLRNLPSVHGQALPRTSHKPLGPALYDRLFALGHDPGPRPHR